MWPPLFAVWATLCEFGTYRNFAVHAQLSNCVPRVLFVGHMQLCVFVWFDSLRPCQQVFSYVRRLFLGRTSTKQRIKCLAL